MDVLCLLPLPCSSDALGLFCLPVVAVALIVTAGCLVSSLCASSCWRVRKVFVCVGVCERQQEGVWGRMSEREQTGTPIDGVCVNIQIVRAAWVFLSNPLCSPSRSLPPFLWMDPSSTRRSGTLLPSHPVCVSSTSFPPLSSHCHLQI